MTDMLIRLFVKNSDNVKDKKVREKYGVLAGIVGIAANTLLCAVKFAIGVLTGSVAVQADAVNNLADIGSNAVTLVGAKLAAKPATKEHPYGHARMEYIAALVISFFIIMVGYSLVKESIDKILHPTAVDFTPITMLVLALSIGVKLWMGLFTSKIGKRIDSATMSAATADSLMDSISTGAILLSSLINYFFKVNLDGVIGLCVAVFVLYAGIKLVKETISPLMGEAPDPELVKELDARLKTYDKVYGTHDILIHSYGPGTIIASAHAEVPADCDMLEMHEIIDRAELEIGEEMGMLLTIHMDPIETRDEESNRVRGELKEIIDSFNGRIRFHDFRMVSGESRNNLIFDIVVPISSTKEEIEDYIQKIRTKALEKDPTYRCVINVDYDYSGEM